MFVSRKEWNELKERVNTLEAELARLKYRSEIFVGYPISYSFLCTRNENDYMPLDAVVTRILAHLKLVARRDPGTQPHYILVSQPDNMQL